MALPPVRAARRLRQLCAFGLVAAAGLAGAVAAAPGDWRLPGLDGGAFAAQDVAQGTTAMVLWAGWSPRCRDVVERSNALAAQLQGKARVVMVNFQEEAGEVDGFLADKGRHLPVYLDGDGSFAKTHRVTTLPGMVVYRDGSLVYQGKFPDDPVPVVLESSPR